MIKSKNALILEFNLLHRKEEMALDVEVSVLKSQSNSGVVGFAIEAQNDPAGMYCMHFAQDLSEDSASVEIVDDELRLCHKDQVDLSVKINPADAETLQRLFADESRMWEACPHGIENQGFRISLAGVEDQDLVTEKCN